jgi:hypothetical protein
LVRVWGRVGRVRGAAGRSAYLRAISDKPRAHAVVMQSIAAERFRGRRVRLAAWIATEQAQTAYFGVNAVVGDTSLGRAQVPIKGTTTWQRHEVVVDVPPLATSVHFGLLLEGTGAAWIDDVSFDVVDDTVPLTNAPRLPPEPRNLDFER